MSTIYATCRVKRQRRTNAEIDALIATCYDILEDIQPASVRAVVYRLFLRGLIPDAGKNSASSVSRWLTQAREDGRIPWAWIVDEHRAIESRPSWVDPAAFVGTVRRAYRRDRWAEQPRRVEVWSEKGTVRGTLKPVIDEYGVPLCVMHGYSSATVANDIAARSEDDPRPLIALYVGDFDPSGMHMSVADLPERIARYGGTVEIRRVALTGDDVEYGRLPSFDVAAKRGDARHAWFVARYGTRCVELDALSPVLFRERLRDTIKGLIDWDSWKREETAEAAELASLQDVLDTWTSLAVTP